MLKEVKMKDGSQFHSFPEETSLVNKNFAQSEDVKKEASV